MLAHPARCPVFPTTSLRAHLYGGMNTRRPLMSGAHARASWASSSRNSTASFAEGSTILGCAHTCSSILPGSQQDRAALPHECTAGLEERTNERTNERQETHVGIECVAFPLEHKRRWLHFTAPIHPLVIGHNFEHLKTAAKMITKKIKLTLLLMFNNLRQFQRQSQQLDVDASQWTPIVDKVFPPHSSPPTAAPPC
jgi:hypothetical protein